MSGTALDGRKIDWTALKCLHMSMIVHSATLTAQVQCAHCQAVQLQQSPRRV